MAEIDLKETTAVTNFVCFLVFLFSYVSFRYKLTEKLDSAGFVNKNLSNQCSNVATQKNSRNAAFVNRTKKIVLIAYVRCFENYILFEGTAQLFAPLTTNSLHENFIREG